MSHVQHIRRERAPAIQPVPEIAHSDTSEPSKAVRAVLSHDWNSHRAVGREHSRRGALNCTRAPFRYAAAASFERRPDIEPRGDGDHAAEAGFLLIVLGLVHLDDLGDELVVALRAFQDAGGDPYRSLAAALD